MKKTVNVLLGSLLVSSGLLWAATEPAGMTVSLQGSATATGADGVARALQVESEVFLNDTIRTPAASKLQILFSDDSIFSVGENSEVTLDEYLFNPDQPQENAFGARLGRGVFRAVTGRITEMNPDRFSVQTSRATIGIRGCDLAFEVLPSEDRVFVFYIPPGRSIFVEPVEGDPRREIFRPSVVIIDEQGRMQVRDLQSEDRSRIRDAVTPANGVSATEDDESDPAIAAVDPSTADPEGPVDGDLGEGDVVMDDTIAQDTNQPVETERVLTGAEIDQIIAHSQMYDLSGTGTASATIRTYDNGMILFEGNHVNEPFGVHHVSGPASVSLQIGHGHADMTLSANMQNDSGRSLSFTAESGHFYGSNHLVLDHLTDFQMHADGNWVQGNVRDFEAHANLYGTGGDAPPTATKVENGFIYLEGGPQDRTAEVDFSTSKIELR